MPLALYIAAGTLILGIIGQLRGWWESPRRKEERDKAQADRELNQAMAAALLGRREIRDHAGGILVPKELGLVAKVDGLERDVSDATATLSTLVDQNTRITALETGYVSLAARVASRETKDGEQDAAIAAILANTYERAADTTLQAEEKRTHNIIEGEVAE